MIDSGASTQFIDPEFTHKLGLRLDQKAVPGALIVVDGREAVAPLTHTCTLDLTRDQRLETLTLQVTKFAGWQIILGKTWLKKHTLLSIGPRIRLPLHPVIDKHIVCPRVILCPY